MKPTMSSAERSGSAALKRDALKKIGELLADEQFTEADRETLQATCEVLSKLLRSQGWDVTPTTKPWVAESPTVAYQARGEQDELLEAMQEFIIGEIREREPLQTLIVR